ncbi:MAG: RNase adaptor protein RapZ, partial [Clostridiales Family XIII bacterium]|nr:RNase adaptor protein RapZ [Clostridiales Family XIII bacterium]
MTNETNDMNIMIITGLSGAGKSQAADYFEDNGYYCIDNLPPSLIFHFLDLIKRGGHRVERVAFVIDIRGAKFLNELTESLAQLKKEGYSYKILFLDAADDVLLRRYNETRRLHPLATGTTNADALRKERKALLPIQKVADLYVDTSKFNNAQLLSVLTEILT